MTIQKLREHCLGTEYLPKEVLNWIHEENWWNIWVPKALGGKEFTFQNGLAQLKELAKIDGSLGWTVTLCAGANFFVGNLLPKTAEKLFRPSTSPVFGGSGGAFGTADKQGSTYRLSGTWKYATGAPYLTHFTLNAKIREGGKPVLDEKGNPLVRSFLLPASKVTQIPDWEMMGLQATATFSFKVEGVEVNAEDSFLYNHFYREEAIFKLPFTVFADLTLWANYLGMAEHYLEEARKITSNTAVQELADILDKSVFRMMETAQSLDREADQSEGLIVWKEERQNHEIISEQVRELSQAIVQVHPFLGMKASRAGEQLSQIFRDYFTATQHHNFVKR